MATGSGKKDAREARERTRLYEARRSFHEAQLQRRGRDNLLAGIVGGALILAVAAGQVAYFTVGPGIPVPIPTATEPAIDQSPLLPEETPAPAEETPAVDTPTEGEQETPPPTDTPEPTP